MQNNALIKKIVLEICGFFLGVAAIGSMFVAKVPENYIGSGMLAVFSTLCYLSSVGIKKSK
jgi:hypothetical protein